MNINPYEILSYGVIGLGFLLALFSYRLLTKEQKRDEPRNNILKAINIYMVFSIVLCIVGIVAEVVKRNPREVFSTEKTKETQTTKVVLNNKYKTDNRPLEKIFEDGPITLKLRFEEFELKGPEPVWQYTFFNDRIRFKAGFNEEVGKYITGCVFRYGEPAEKVTPIDSELLIDNRHIYFGWIESPQNWGGYSGEYRLSRKEISTDWEIDPVTGDKVKYGSVFFQGFANTDFKAENNSMIFKLLEYNNDWALIQIDMKYN